MSEIAHAIVESHVTAKARSTFRAHYDPEMMLTRFELRGPIGFECHVRTDQLASLVEILSEALEQAKADPHSVGHSLLEAREANSNPRLGHLLEVAS